MSFCYSWLLLLIVLVTWDTLEESVLPELPPGMCEGAWYAHLWDSRDVQRVEDNKVFWVLFQRSVAAAINSRPRLSPTIYDKYKSIAAFQVTMHHIQICSLQNMTWMALPYMVSDDEIHLMITLWPPAWKNGLTDTLGETAVPR